MSATARSTKSRTKKAAASVVTELTQPSSKYAEPIADLESYLALVQEQEDTFVAAGFPADGITVDIQ
ncbi:hypothetical protein IB286_15305 [Spongiibacter sp. KMU-158]|uniref:Uncharacterized protein n=1 Tax=Spongiibacter pelagi TaxID=2760804 RepID=A0A927GYE3_9GAMM|nr:hypothetical protein [Spongiibacter pelagi]MBD2860359.1 hypothetical protein [Spongiibacter pelagi]